LSIPITVLQGLSMHPDLHKLLDLQAKDAALADVDARLAALDAELEVLDGDRRRAQDAADQARRAAEEGARRRDELESKIESYRSLQERRRQRLEFVRNPKEASTLMAEMDLARSVIAKEESDWVRSADTVTALEAKAGDELKQLEQVDAEQRPKREELAARRGEIEADRERLQAEREASASRLDRALRTRYDRLRRARATAAVVVPLNGDACGACFTAVPRNRRSQIRAGTILDGCEACGVILYAAGS
jgi:predicted  nucleic acid-binding Zn-ribbon protein